MKDFLLKLNAVVNLTRLLYIFLRSLDSSPIFRKWIFYSGCKGSCSHDRKSSSESSDELLSVECIESGSCELIGQFSRDDTSCKIQVAYIARDWSVLICR